VQGRGWGPWHALGSGAKPGKPGRWCRGGAGARGMHSAVLVAQRVRRCRHALLPLLQARLPQAGSDAAAAAAGGASPFGCISATMGWETFHMVQTLWHGQVRLLPRRTGGALWWLGGLFPPPPGGGGSFVACWQPPP